MLIRPATLADVEALATVHVRGWRIGYAGLLPQEVLDRLSVEERTARWQEIVAASDLPRRGPLVAEVGGEVAGFSYVGPSRDEASGSDDGPGGHGEVWSFYVDPDRWRGGIGRTLMAAALGTLREAGRSDAVLWVLADNARAIAFYEATGWTRDGRTKTDTFAGVEIAEVRMHHDLRGSA